jgi:Mrp family chromosome partitioning ATPase
MRAVANAAGAREAPPGDEDRPGDVRYRFSPELLTLRPSESEAKAAIQALGAQLIAHHLEAGHRGLAVCGASLGVGVTFIAANIAVALAQSGVPTLLLDANLHTPGIHKVIAPSRELPGLQQLLRIADLDRTEVEQVDVLPNLSIIYSGGTAQDAAELIGGHRFKDLIDGCLRDYVFTVIDTPAANRSADALRISRTVGHSLIVTRRNLTYAEDAETLSQELTQDDVHVIGALLNGA